MTHEDAIDRSLDRLLGALDDPGARDLESHLGICEDCRSIDDAVRILRSVMPSAEMDPDHPYSEEIVAWALDRDALAEHDRGWIASHLASCPTCAAEAERVEDVERRTTAVVPMETPRRVRRPGVAWAIAASIALAVLAYPAYLGLVRLPRVASELDAERVDRERLVASVDDLSESSRAAGDELDALRSWGGTVDLVEIRSALRDAGAGTEIVVDRTRPFVLLGVDARIPRDLAEDEMLRVRIVPTDDPSRALLTVDLPVEEARRRIRETGILTVLVGTAALEPGRHELDVFLPDRPDEPDLLEVPIDIR